MTCVSASVYFVAFVPVPTSNLLGFSRHFCLFSTYVSAFAFVSASSIFVLMVLFQLLCSF